MTRTIVHAGFHKTGTTTLQDFLATHRRWLAEQGLHYPADLQPQLTGHHSLAGRLSVARTLDGPNDLFTIEREVFSRIIGARDLPAEAFATALSTDLPLTLLSSEEFETFNPAELSNLESCVGFIDRFVLYVRSGIKYIFSCWSAKVRWGYTGAFKTFLRATVDFEPATAVLGPVQFVDMLIDRFGRDRIKVRSFDDAFRHPRGLIGDFVEKELRLAEPKGLRTDYRSNVSPPAVITEVQRALNIWAGVTALGMAPASHTSLRAALAAPDGKRLLEEFTDILAPIMKTITIGDCRPSTISNDGSIRCLSGRSASLLGIWRFPWEEGIAYCETEELTQALEPCESFIRFVGEA
jgi:hypothetical protein